MTEDEARKKWCPYASTSYAFRTMDVAVGITRVPGKYESETRCLASQCMAWRWEKWDEISGSDGQVTGRVSDTNGYCGLAGQP